jgi:heme ABC exporter ATP-binding subunit CcmA
VNAVEVRDLDKDYGAVRALRGLSFEIPAGAICHVTGANGAGKSTLLRVLASLTRPTAGSVRVLGENPFGRGGARVRRDLAWLGASAGLYGDLTIEENLRFAAELCGAEADRVEVVLEELGLGSLRHRRARTLSEGYRRRAGLARVLLPQPQLLLLDEPWNGLDAEASEKLAKALREHRSRGGTAVVASHHRAEAAELADEVVTLHRGGLAPGGAA